MVKSNSGYFEVCLLMIKGSEGYLKCIPPSQITWTAVYWVHHMKDKTWKKNWIVN